MCKCRPGERESGCPYCQGPLLDAEQIRFLVMVEESYRAARQPVPTHAHSLRLFELATRVVTERIG